MFSSRQASRAKHLTPYGSQIDPLTYLTTGGGPGLINTALCFLLTAHRSTPFPATLQGEGRG
jgi:hypothetical protein